MKAGKKLYIVYPVRIILGKETANLPKGRDAKSQT